MYRIVWTGTRPTAKGPIVLECAYQVSDDGENWTTIEGAPTTLELKSSAVRGALRVEGVAEKRAAMLELIRSTARSQPIVVGSVLIDDLVELLPAGYPVTIRV